MHHDPIYQRYEQLQAYVGWTEEDARRVHGLLPLLQPRFAGLVDDFYEEIQRHPETMKVMTGGAAQIPRLKGTLVRWLEELFSGRYDRDYVRRRWQVGRRHVEIGLQQVYTNAALSRLRLGLTEALARGWAGGPAELQRAAASLHKLLDLDLAIIEEAYQTESSDRLRQRSEATFRTLVEAAPCMIVILRPDRSILYFSPHAERLTGYAAGEVVGRNYLEQFVDGPAREQVGRLIDRAAPEAPAVSFESPVRCKDGEQRWVVWNAQSLCEYDHGPAVVVVGQDITNWKEAQDRALQAERLAAIGQMVAGLAHESGNALGRIQGNLEMLAMEVEDRPEAVELIGRMQAAQNDLNHLFEEVRSYAGRLQLDREIWDVSSVWQQAWRNLDLKRKGRQVELVEQTGGLDLHCTVDSFRLEQVFRNVFDNALAACKDPVEVTVACAEAHLGDTPALRIEVRDNGPGIDPSRRQKVFDPFFTTKTKGTGLGMAIAKRIIEAHQGSIAVGEAKGRGATILILLPR